MSRIYTDCNNAIDHSTQDEFDEKSDIIYIKIHDKWQCFDRASLKYFFDMQDREQSMMAYWVGGESDTGYGGKPDVSRLVYKLPNGAWVDEHTKLMLSGVFEANNVKPNIPIGNVHGTMGASQLHGNNPAYIYSVNKVDGWKVDVIEIQYNTSNTHFPALDTLVYDSNGEVVRIVPTYTNNTVQGYSIQANKNFISEEMINNVISTLAGHYNERIVKKTVNISLSTEQSQPSTADSASGTAPSSPILTPTDESEYDSEYEEKESLSRFRQMRAPSPRPSISAPTLISEALFHLDITLPSGYFNDHSNVPDEEFDDGSILLSTRDDGIYILTGGDFIGMELMRKAIRHIIAHFGFYESDMNIDIRVRDSRYEVLLRERIIPQPNLGRGSHERGEHEDGYRFVNIQLIIPDATNVENVPRTSLYSSVLVPDHYDRRFRYVIYNPEGYYIDNDDIEDAIYIIIKHFNLQNKVTARFVPLSDGGDVDIIIS